MFLEALKFERRRILRFFPTVFFSLVFPVMLLLIFGTVYGNSPSNFFSGNLGTVDATVPSYMALVMAVTGLMSFPLTMAEYRDRGVLRRLQMTPATPTKLLLAQFVVNVALTIIGVVLLVLVGLALLDLTLTSNWAAFLPVFLLSIIAIFSIGLLVASWAPNERTATLVANLVYFPMIFLSGATIPSEMLPGPVQTAAKALPITWAVELLFSAWNDTSYPNWYWAIAVLLGTTVSCGLLSARSFRWN